MIKPFEPREPNCKEMVEYLLNTDHYEGKSQETLLSDNMLKIVASSCKMDIKSVVDLLFEILSSRKRE